MTYIPQNILHTQYLNAMGIQVWIRRDLPPVLAEESSPVNTSATRQSELSQAHQEMPTINSSEPPVLQPATVSPPNEVIQTPQPAIVNTISMPSEHAQVSQPVTNVEPTSPKITQIPPPVTENIAPSVLPSDDTPVSELDWESLQNQVTVCTACDLHKTRTQTVFGMGNRQADLLLIGEAPGADEDAQGEPFVGPAGQLLNAMLYAIDLKREDVYIVNVVKCRPPENRNPELAEMACCNAFLQRQIMLVKPKLIIAVGRVAAHHLLATTTAIGKLRGQRFTYGESKIPLIATYHPAYLLRRPTEKRQSWQDLQFIRQTMAELNK